MMIPKYLSNKHRLLCGRIGCSNMGDKSCAACFRVDYCSEACQKADWGAHKRYCKQMTRRLDSFSDCPKQEAAISERLDTAEEYLSMSDPELAGRLRVSSFFMERIDTLRERMQNVDSEDKKTMRHLACRLKSILDRIRDAVEVGRVCSNEKDYEFWKQMLRLNIRYCVRILLTYFSREEQLETLQEGLRLARSFPMTDNDFKTRVIIDCLQVLHVIYMKAGDHEKALEVLEETYRVRSEYFGPEDILLQRSTLNLCELLAKMGEHDRMLEYLHVAVDNISDSSRSDSPEVFILVRCNTSCIAAKTLFTCACSLPEGRCETTIIFADAFKMMIESMECRIQCRELSPPIEFASTLSNATEHALSDDVKIDYNRLMNILVKTYDFYSSTEDDEMFAHTVREICIILSRYIGLKLSAGTSIPGFNFTSFTALITRLELLTRQLSGLGLDEHKLKGDLEVAERAGNLNEEVRLRKLLEKADLQSLLFDARTMFPVLRSYCPSSSSSSSSAPSTSPPSFTFFFD